MNRDERFYAYIVAHTSRSRSAVRRVAIHRRWVKATALFVAFLFCVAAYGVYGLTHQGGSNIALILTIFFLAAIATIAYGYFRSTKTPENVSQSTKTQEVKGRPEDEEVPVAQKEAQADISKMTESFICIFLSERDADNILGDLQETLHTYKNDWGRFRAKLWLYEQLVKSVLPLLIGRIRQAALNLAKSWRRL